MSMHVNKVFFTGRLVRDPDLRTISNGTPVCNITLAQNTRYKEGDKWVDGEPVFLDVALWGRRGESFARHHKKGDEAFIEGKLRLDKWEDRETKESRSKMKVDADEWQFVPRGAPRDGTVPAPGTSADGDTPF
jgi:single-strand DNA-binding protein